MDAQGSLFDNGLFHGVFLYLQNKKSEFMTALFKSWHHKLFLAPIILFGMYPLIPEGQESFLPIFLLLIAVYFYFKNPNKLNWDDAFSSAFDNDQTHISASPANFIISPPAS